MDINSSIPKLDPMHVEVSTFITPGRETEECEEGIKQEEYKEEYLPEEIYVQSSGYHEAVFSLPGDHSGHCDAGPAYSYTLTCSGQLQEGGAGLSVKYPAYRGHHLDQHQPGDLEQGAPYTGQGAPVPVISHGPGLPGQLPPHGGGLGGAGARHTPPPPYNNSYSSASFSPCSSSSSSLSPPINVSTRYNSSEFCFKVLFLIFFLTTKCHI